MALGIEDIAKIPRLIDIVPVPEDGDGDDDDGDEQLPSLSGYRHVELGELAGKEIIVREVLDYEYQRYVLAEVTDTGEKVCFIVSTWETRRLSKAGGLPVRVGIIKTRNGYTIR